MIEFEAWPKLPRLNKPVIVTEKIDGTNAAITFHPVTNHVSMPGPLLMHGTESKKAIWYLEQSNRPLSAICVDNQTDTWMLVGAQSRTRLLAIDQDNFGFASWVAENAHTLYALLGPGRHFGEWWGKGIQRGYGQTGKRFSLFNAVRYATLEHWFDGDTRIDTVPILSELNGFADVMTVVDVLREKGSVAAPGFMNPEGVVAFHTAGRSMFKAFCENDEIPKGDNR